MLPWGHAALGYLCYSLWRRLHGETPSRGTLVLALGIGTQFPDIVDKPLAWSFALLPSGRSLAHSLVVLLPVALLFIAMQRRAARRASAHPTDSRPATVGGAFLFGWAAHLLGDSWQFLIGRADCVSFLLWPITPLCPYDESGSVTAHLLAVEFSANTQLGLVLTAVAIVVWLLDGSPGYDELRQALSR